MLQNKIWNIILPFDSLQNYKYSEKDTIIWRTPQILFEIT